MQTTFVGALRAYCERMRSKSDDEKNENWSDQHRASIMNELSLIIVTFHPANFATCQRCERWENLWHFFLFLVVVSASKTIWKTLLTINLRKMMSKRLERFLFDVGRLFFLSEKREQSHSIHARSMDERRCYQKIGSEGWADELSSFRYFHVWLVALHLI